MPFGGSSPFDAIRREDERGEWWSGRELMPLLGYARWQRFRDAVGRAKEALRANGENPEQHVTGAEKMVETGQGSSKAIEDFRLTRYGAYAVVQGGDPRKPEIAAGWSYFRVRTREAEVAVRAPGSYLEALEAAAQIERQRIALAAEVQTLAPKAEEHDVFLASGSNAYPMRTVAKSMGTGLTRLYRWMRQVHVLYPAQRDGNHPYQEFVERGWFDVRYEPTENGRKWVHVPYATPKGVSGIYRKLRQAGYDVDEPTELLP